MLTSRNERQEIEKVVRSVGRPWLLSIPTSSCSSSTSSSSSCVSMKRFDDCVVSSPCGDDEDDEDEDDDEEDDEDEGRTRHGNAAPSRTSQNSSTSSTRVVPVFFGGEMPHKRSMLGFSNECFAWCAKNYQRHEVASATKKTKDEINGDDNNNDGDDNGNHSLNDQQPSSSPSSSSSPTTATATTNSKEPSYYFTHSSRPLTRASTSASVSTATPNGDRNTLRTACLEWFSALVPRNEEKLQRDRERVSESYYSMLRSHYCDNTETGNQALPLLPLSHAEIQRDAKPRHLNPQQDYDAPALTTLTEKFLDILPRCVMADYENEMVGLLRGADQRREYRRVVEYE